MPVHEKYVKELFEEFASDIFDGIEDRLSFLKKLEEDDDWSFVIKIQTLVEAAVTEAVVGVVGEPRLKKLVERLPLTDDEVGKLGVATDLGLITKRQRRFIRKMAALRNHLAHKVEYVDFSFDKYLASKDAAALRDWKESISWFTKEDEDSSFWQDSSVTAPRTVIFVSAFMFLVLLHIATVEAGSGRRIDAVALKTAEEMYEKILRTQNDDG
jgi:hypothetical protein